jgi:CheY-like chemotaxis protein
MTTVLIVDDDAAICALLGQVLQDEGFLVRVARNGQEALNRLQHVSGWVVLLDLNMPIVDGYEVIRRLNANPAWLDDHRVVLMSAGRNLALTHLPSLSEVVQALVPKPFELDALLEVVQRVAAGQEAGEKDR